MCGLPSGLHVSDNSLPTVRDVDVLHRDRLLAACPVFAKGLGLGSERSRQLVEPSVMGLHLIEPIRMRELWACSPFPLASVSVAEVD